MESCDKELSRGKAGSGPESKSAMLGIFPFTYPGAGGRKTGKILRHCQLVSRKFPPIGGRSGEKPGHHFLLLLP